MKHVVLLILFTLCMGASSSCSTQQIKSLCVINIEDGMCWIKKSENKGFRLDQMDGYFSMDKEDLKKILQRLNDCQNPE